MLPTPEFISTFISQQFPAFYREEGDKFIQFVKAYYEWLEQNGQASNKTRNLYSTRDIDLTAEQFIENFKEKYLFGIPAEIAGDKRFLQKHVLDLYRSKGSIEGLKLLFRLLYNEEINVYIPSVDILKPSDGTWVEKKYLEVSHTDFNDEFNNKLITGGTSGAKAFVESFERLYADNRIIDIFFISNIQGTFIVNEKITYEGLDAFFAPKILGSPTTIQVTGTVPNNDIGDSLLPTSGNGSGIGLKTLVSTTRNAGSSNATIEFKVINGGYGYTTTPVITISTGSNSSGSNATFSGVVLKNTISYPVSNTFINYAPYYASTKSFNANTSVSNTSDFITIANNTFANNDYVLYYTAAGNTPLSGLTNNTSYWVVSANSSGVKLALTPGGANINITSGASQTGHYLYRDAVVRFNANGGVSNTNKFISINNNQFANGDYVKYFVDAGNTAISGLANNTGYFIVGANSSGVKLATGNSTTYNTTPISITSGSTQYGHTLLAFNTANLALNLVSWGSHLFAANLASVINTAITTYSITIGSIDRLTGINPGNGYDGYVNITVEEPIIAGFNKADANGAIWGKNAQVFGNVVIGTNLVETVKIKNSGFGYHTNLEDIELYNTTKANTSQLTRGSIILGGVGIKEGFWSSTKGFLDSNKFIQDSYYYQEYSYQILSSKSLDKYLKVLKDVFHPVGNEVFGKALILMQDDSPVEISNSPTAYRILGSQLAPEVDPEVDLFTLNVSRLK